jgi:hypothetical protein
MTWVHLWRILIVCIIVMHQTIQLLRVHLLDDFFELAVVGTVIGIMTIGVGFSAVLSEKDADSPLEFFAIAF